MRRSRGSPRGRSGCSRRAGPRKALEAISGAEGDRPRSGELHLVQGLALVALGKSEPARKALLQSIAIRPDQPMAAKVLAAIAFSRGEEQRGLEYLARAAALDPGDFRPLYAAGEVHFRTGRMDAAIRAFEAALLRKADHQESRIGLLAASLAIRPPEQSSALVRGLLRDFPGNPQVQVLAARHARALGDAGSSLRYAERAIELDPDFVDAIVIRAHLLLMTGKAKPALAEATRCMNATPGTRRHSRSWRSSRPPWDRRSCRGRRRRVAERSSPSRSRSAS